MRFKNGMLRFKSESWRCQTWVNHAFLHAFWWKEFVLRTLKTAKQECIQWAIFLQRVIIHFAQNNAVASFEKWSYYIPIKKTPYYDGFARLQWTKGGKMLPQCDIFFSFRWHAGVLEPEASVRPALWLLLGLAGTTMRWGEIKDNISAFPTGP